MEFNLNNKSLEELEEKLEKAKNEIDPGKAMKKLKEFGSDAMKSISDLISEE